MLKGLVMRIFQVLLCILFTASTACLGYSTSSFLLARSQGEDSARWLSGWAHKVNKWGMGCGYAALALVPEYNQTFNDQDITRCFFGDDLFDDCTCPYLKISGSSVSGRNTEREWLADYFGLPTDFQSIVRFSPSVINALLDVNLYIGLDQWKKGFYLNFYAPLVYTRSWMNMKETVIDPGQLGYVAGYMAPQAIARENLLNTFTDFISLGKRPTLSDNVVFCPLERSCIAARPKHKVGIADIHAVAGWNFIMDEEYHIGGNVRLVFPTGNRPVNTFLFEPVVGNGGFYEMGFGFSSHALLWRDQACEREWGLYLEAWITHMFPAYQRRSFDIKGVDNGRYALAELMTETVLDDLQTVGIGVDTAANAQFNKVLTPLANVSTIPVNVTVIWQADFSMMLNYYSRGFEFDFGYNYWMRKPERVHVREDGCNNLLDRCLFALKGDSQIYGFKEGTDQAVALSATQMRSTLTTGLNYPELSIGEGITNPRVDNPQDAFSGVDQLVTQPLGTEPIKTSIQPRILTLDDFSLCRTSTHGVSNSIFAHFNYTWDHHGHWWQPYLGLGFKVEVASEKPDQECPSVCSSSHVVGPAPCGTCDEDTLLQCGFSSWHIWLKGGFAFD